MVGGNYAANGLDAFVLISKVATHFLSGSQMGSTQAAIMSSWAFRRLVDILEFGEGWPLEFGRWFMVENEITMFTPRISLSTPCIIPRDANKPSDNSKVVLVNIFVSVSVHREKSQQSRQRMRVDPTHL